jgi:hypothetical protein
MESAGTKQGKSERNLLMSLAISDINMARVFVEGARSAFSAAHVEEGEFARLRAVKFYCEAIRSVLQVAESDRESFSSDLQYLHTQIEWLLIRSGVLNSPLTIQEEATMKKLVQLLGGKG